MISYPISAFEEWASLQVKTFLQRIQFRAWFAKLGLLVALVSPSVASAVPYYLFTPITGANTTFDATHSSVWTFNVSSSGSFDFGGGTFTIKQGGKPTDDPYLIVYSGSEAPTSRCSINDSRVLKYATIPRNSVTGQYTPTAINFDVPITLTAGVYRVELCSNTATNGSQQYFIKGANNAFIGDVNQTPIDPSKVTVAPQAPNVTIQKQATSTVNTNGAITYTLSLGNTGSLDLGAGAVVTVQDLLPAGVTATAVATSAGVSAVSCTNLNYSGALLTCSVTLSSGLSAGAAVGSAAFTITATAPSTSGRVTNYASVDAGGGTTPPYPGTSCSPTSSCSSAYTDVSASSSLTITKSATSSVSTSGTITYGIGIGNTGDANYGTSGSTVIVKDQLPSGVSVTGVALGSGFSAVSCTDQHSHTATNTSSATLTAGDLLTCTATLSSSIAAGTAATSGPSFTLTATAPSSAIYITNYASVASNGGSSPPAPGASCSPSANCASASTTVGDTASFTILKKGPSVARTSTNYTYSLYIGNSGNVVSGLSATIKDQLPAGVTVSAVSAGSGVSGVNCGTLPSTAAALLTCTVTLSAGIQPNTQAENGAYITLTAQSSTTGDKVNYVAIDPTGGSSPTTPGSSCSAAYCSSVTTTINNTGVILNLTKRVLGTPTQVVSGATTTTTIVWEIDVANNSGVTLGKGSSVLYVTDKLPSNLRATAVSESDGDIQSIDCGTLPSANGATLSCRAALQNDLMSGQSATFSLTTTTTSTSGTIVNYASIANDGTSATLTPGSSCASSTACASASYTLPTLNLILAKSATAVVSTNGSITYTLRVGNSGGISASSGSTITVSDVLPSGVTVTGISGSGISGFSSCNFGGSSFTAASTGLSLAGDGTKVLKCTATLSSSIAAGTSTSSGPYITLTATAPSSIPAGGTITNYASIDSSGSTSPPTPGGSCSSSAACSSAITTITSSPSFTLSKSAIATVAGGSTVTTGDSITYTLKIGNNGGALSGTVATVSDVLPSGVTAVKAEPGSGVTSVSCTNLNVASATLVCTLNLSAGIASGTTASSSSTYFTITANASSSAGTITNYASIDPTGGSTPTTPGSSCTTAYCSSANMTVQTGSNLTLSKSVNVTSAYTGSALTYTIKIGNTGSSNFASGSSVTVADQLPPGVILTGVATGTGISSVNCGTLPSAAGALLTCSLITSSAIASGTAASSGPSFLMYVTAPSTAGTITNYASVDPTGGGVPPTPGPSCLTTACSQSSTTTTTVSLGPNLVVRKSATSNVAPSGTITYTFKIGNNGAGNYASGSTITIKDQLPSGVTANSAATVNGLSSISCGTLSSAGALLTCTATLSSALAAGTDTSAVGAPSFTISATAPSVSGNITNYASIDPTGSTTPPTPGASCAPSANCTSASTNVTSGPNYTLAKSATSSVNPLGQITYTLKIGNSGAGNASSGSTITIYDQLPAGVTGAVASAGTGTGAPTCTSNYGGTTGLLRCTVTLTSAISANTVASSSTTYITIAAYAPNSGGTSITNYASIDGSGGGNPPTPGPTCSPSSSCSSASTTITASPNLTLTKSATASVAQGGTITYTFLIGNSGSGAYSGSTVTLKDKLPAGVIATAKAVVANTGVSSVDCGTLPSTAAALLTCTVNLSTTISPYSTGPSFTITATAPASSGTITNYASVATDGGSTVTDPSSSCTTSNCSGAETLITGANLSISKTGDSSVNTGATFNYKLGIGNETGASTLIAGSTITIKDQLPTGVAVTAVSGLGISNVSCTNLNVAGAVLVCSGDVTSQIVANSSAATAAASGSGPSFVFTATAPGTGGSITNYASIDPTGGSSPATPSAACVSSHPTYCASFTNTVTANPSLVLAKAVSSSTVNASASYSYSIRVGNAGSASYTTPTAITIKDQLPSGVSVTGVALGSGFSAVSCTDQHSHTATNTSSATLTAGDLLTCTATLSSSIGAGTSASSGPYFTLTASAPSSASIVVNYASVDPLGGVSPPTPSASCLTNNCASVSTNIIANTGAVSGRVTKKLPGGGSTIQSGVTVKLYDANNNLVGTTTTDTNGAYSFTSLPTGNYNISFTAPGGSKGIRAGNSMVAASTSTITSAGVTSGSTTTDQDAVVIDPSGVVYDSLTRLPVAGATVTLMYNGSAVPDSWLDTVLGTANNAVTNSTGSYNLFLNGSAPSGTYTLVVTPPTNYVFQSTIIPPTTGPYVPSLGGGTEYIQTQTTAPTGGDATTYYLSFTFTISGSLSTTSNGVANNHIPLDPKPKLSLSKSNPSLAAGGTASYVLTISNSGATATSTNTVTVVDTLPSALTYTTYSTSSGMTCSASGQDITCTGAPNIAASSSVTITINVSVSATASGTVINGAYLTALGGDPQTAATNTNLTNLTDPAAGSTTTSTSGLVTKVAKAITTGTVSVTKTLYSVNGSTSAVSGYQAKSGDVLVYRIAVTETSNAASGVTTLTETVPGNTTYTGTSEGWILSGSNYTQSVTVAANGTEYKYFTVTVSTLTNGVTSISNTVSSSAGTCASCTVTSPTVPRLAITKSGSGSLSLGATTSYSLVITNNGGSTTSGTVTVTDTLPSGLTFASQTAGSPRLSCTASGQVITCTGTPNITAGASLTVTYTVSVAAPASGLIVNSAIFTALGGDPRTPANDAATPSSGSSTQGSDALSAKAAGTVTATNFSIVKSLESYTRSSTIYTDLTNYQVRAGDILKYKITISNSSSSGGSTVITENLPTNTTYTGTGEGWPSSGPYTQTVSVGGSTSSIVYFTVTVGSLPDSAALITNTVTASVGTCTTCTLSYPTAPKLTLYKSIPSSMNAGGTTTYDLTISNVGGSTTSGIVTVIDVLPSALTYASYSTASGVTCSASSQTITCTGTPSIAAGGSIAITLTVNISASASGTIINGAYLSALGGDPQTVATGTDLTNLSDPSAGVSSQSSSKLVAKSAKAITTGTVSVTKTLYSVNGLTSAVSGYKAKSGDVLVYNIAVAETGATASGTATLTETVPANTSYSGNLTSEGWIISGSNYNQTVTVSASQTVNKTFTVTVGALTDGVTSIANTVTVSAGTTCSSCTVTLPTVPRLAVAKSYPTSLLAGGTTSYTLTLTNNGGSATVGTVSVTDTLPTGLTFASQTAGSPSLSCSASGQVITCTGTPNIAAGSSLTVSYTVNISYSATGILINAVQYTAVGGDPRGAPGSNGSATPTTGTSTQSTDKLSAKSAQTVTVGTLSVQKTLYSVASGSSTITTGLTTYIVKPSDQLTYRIRVTETSNTAGATTLLTETLPANTTYTGSSEGWSGSGPYTQTVNVAQNGYQDVYFTVTAASSFAAGTLNIANTVTSSAASSCSTGCAVTNPTPPRLAIAKVANQTSITASATGTFTVTLSNAGGSPTSANIVFVDTLPAGLTYVSASGTNFSCVASGQLITCTYSGVIAAQSGATPGSASVTYTVSASGVSQAGIINNVIIDVTQKGGDVRTNSDTSSSATDPTAAGNSTQSSSGFSAKAKLNIAAPNLKLTKTVNSSLVSVGAAQTYTLTITNLGSVTSGTSATIQEAMPLGSVITAITGVSGMATNGVVCSETLGGTSVGANYTTVSGTPLYCSITLSAGLASGGAASFSITANAPSSAGSYTNYATIDPVGGSSPGVALNCSASNTCASASSTVSSGAATLTIQKIGSASSVELGDSLLYTLTVKLVSGSTQAGVAVTDTLPRGFKYIPNSAKVAMSGSSSAITQGDAILGISGVGPTLLISIGTMQVNDTATITYRVRVGVGAQQGDGINKAIARSASGSVSNEARYKVTITDGVFTSTSCVVGKVYIDCNGNGIQDDDEQEMGIPGVRLYMEDGTYLISDNKGKYSICGLTATTHVFKVDPITLPKGSVLLPSSNRNAGDPGSLFTDLKFGELHRADFIEGTCSPEVLKQTKARQEKAVGARDGVPLPALSAQGDGGVAAPLQRAPMAAPGQAGVDPLLKGDRQEIIIRFDSENGQDPFCSSEFPAGNVSPVTVCPINKPTQSNQPTVGGVK